MRGYQLKVAKTPLHTETKSVKEWKKAQKKRRKKKKLNKPRKRPDYYEYIESPRWRRKAASFKKKAGKCLKCFTTKGLTVHHLDYKRLGRERYKDVIVLCWRCHQLEHPDKRAEEHIRHITRYG